MSKHFNIKLEQHISTENSEESWTVSWTASRGIKLERWQQTFRTFEQATEFIERGFKD